MTAPSPEARRITAAAVDHVSRAFEGLSVALRRIVANMDGRSPHRAALRGPRRYSENRAAHARRHRELAYLNRRDRRLGR